MSYDLLVFEPSAAPRERDQFIAWWEAQSEWSEAHGYNDPSVPSSALRAWYEEIQVQYPNINLISPSLPAEAFESPRLTDYSLGSVAIYAAFLWSEAEGAYDFVRELAVKHHVGFYDTSGDEGNGEIYFPGDTLRPPSGGAWRQIAKDFQNSRG
jgi:hypothetical protein